MFCDKRYPPPRLGYGARGTTSLHPLDADLNLPKDRYSLGVRRQAAEQAAKNSFDETALALCTTTAAEVPKRQLEQIVACASTDFDAFYVERQAHALSNAPGAGPILMLSMDCKGVVMRKQDLREPTRRKAERRVHKMTKLLARGEKCNAKRMSTVAAVYTSDPFVRGPQDIVRELAPVRDTATRRPRPENKRVWATLEKSPDEVVEEMAREAASSRPRAVQAMGGARGRQRDADPSAQGNGRPTRRKALYRARPDPCDRVPVEGRDVLLRLRSLRASGDFDQYWRFHEQQEQRRNHTALYADANVPPPRPIPRPHANARGHLRSVS
jgi:hypothetical protein